MKLKLLVLIFLAAACSSQHKEDVKISTKQDETEVKQLIQGLHASLAKMYNGAKLDVDSLLDSYYVSDMYYVTAWGTSEPLDSTKKRLKILLPRVKDYENNLQSLQVKVYGDGAYAFFVLRQNYTIDGNPLDEYLPTTVILERQGGKWKIVHVQRSTDLPTIQQYMAMQQKTKSQNK